MEPFCWIVGSKSKVDSGIGGEIFFWVNLRSKHG